MNDWMSCFKIIKGFIFSKLVILLYNGFCFLLLMVVVVYDFV